MSDPIVTGGTILAADFVGTRYYSVSPADIIPKTEDDGYSYDIDAFLASDSAGPFAGVIPIHLPHGAVITNFKVYWFRNDALATGLATLKKNDGAGTSATIAQSAPAASAGYEVESASTITGGTIDNQNQRYLIDVDLTPNDDGGDVGFAGALITYTITTPKP